jgi:hypothetical protein
MKNIITCPKCQTTLDVEQAIKEQLEKDFNADFTQKKTALEKEFNDREQAFQQKEIVLAQEKERQDRIILDKLKQAESGLRSKITQELVEKNTAELDSLKLENQEKAVAIKEMQKHELDLLRQQKQIIEEREALELQVERTLAQERKAIEEKARDKEKEANFLKAQESEMLVKDLRQQLDNMQRKMEQGSMQIQGEVMEVELEKLLAQTFPYDELTEVGKGANGADILHKVRNLQMADCGTIVFESKRTKSFSQAWIDKLKADTRLHKGQIPVLVTEVLPKEMKQFGLKEGVWICTYNEVVALVTVLRHNLLSLQDQKIAGENKGEKQQMLYDYLTSHEFAHQIEFVLSGYKAMQETLERERKSTMKNWKVRQKQIDMMTQNTIDIYGSVKGIAGSSVKEIKELEFDDLLLEEEIENQNAV